MTAIGREVRVSAAAVILWSTAFAALHWYWAFGGRWGLAAEVAAADAALGTVWFAAYNLVVAAVATLTAIVLVPVVRSRGSRFLRRRLAGLSLLAGVLLLGRGLVGTALLIPEVIRGTIDERAPVLLAVEPAFLLGGVLFLRLRRGLGAGRSSANPGRSRSPETGP